MKRVDTVSKKVVWGKKGESWILLVLVGSGLAHLNKGYTLTAF